MKEMTKSIKSTLPQPCDDDKQPGEKKEALDHGIMTACHQSAKPDQPNPLARRVHLDRYQARGKAKTGWFSLAFGMKKRPSEWNSDGLQDYDTVGSGSINDRG